MACRLVRGPMYLSGCAPRFSMTTINYSAANGGWIARYLLDAWRYSIHYVEERKYGF